MPYIVLNNTKYGDYAPTGVPDGGTAGQILAKASDHDGDTVWVNDGSGEVVNDEVTGADTTWSSTKITEELVQNSTLIVTADMTLSGEDVSIANVSHTYAEITAALDAGRPTMMQLRFDEAGDGIHDDYYELALLARLPDMLQYIWVSPQGNNSIISVLVFIYADETTVPTAQRQNLDINIKQDELVGTAGQVVGFDADGKAGAVHRVVGDSPADTDLATVAYVNATAGVVYSLSGTTLTITSATP